MAGGGLSKERLACMHRVMADHVEAGRAVGVITAIERRGETHIDIIGEADRERGTPLKRDTIFRLASMTKPITAAAAMILVEECKIRLDEPVDRLLPELANRRVLKDLNGPIDDTVPARRPITARDLLTFRMGIGTSMPMPGAAPTPFQKAMTAAHLGGFKPPTPHTPDQWIKKLGELPLQYQPGERWQYHMGSDVLGVLIARAAGMPLGDFMRERLFAPLGMKDTGFHVPADKIDRLGSCYAANPQTGELDLYDDAKDSLYAAPPAFPMGGAWLVSTLDDYLAFARMMLNGGKLGSERVLSRTSIEAMRTDQLTDEQKRISEAVPGFFDYQGWGFGVSVVTRRGGPDLSPGRFGWDGAFGTCWMCDPAEEMNAILMLQRMGAMGGPADAGPRADFPTLAYQAIDD
jgi:CubicO group peptidase (beta-lactamase class C family)